MAQISNKKPVFPVGDELRKYLVATHRETDVPIAYRDLFHYKSSIAFTDRKGEDTMWETLVYNETDRDYIHKCLLEIYAQLKVGGDVTSIEHLYIDRVDLCLYGNTRPIRVRIVNKLNDLFDYFYIKDADASRILGMELEHLLSPNKINFLVKGDSVIEEHIPGIPGDDFIRFYMIEKSDFNPLRVAKEFVKFNERCLVQLLGDMRGDNFVIEVVPDFDDVYFRMRAIDFDQQCFEGKLSIYMPQYFKENNPIIELGLNVMSPTLELQYQKEERSRIASRVKACASDLDSLFSAMEKDVISTPENVDELKHGLAELYHDDEFLQCKTMGAILKTSMKMLTRYPVRQRQHSSSGV